MRRGSAQKLAFWSMLFVLTLDAVGHARAQDRVALWTASDTDLVELATQVGNAARAALDTRRVETRSVACDPTEPHCVRRLLRGTGGSRLLVARTIWARGPCVPMIRGGVEVGSRMRGVPVVDITLFAAGGAVLGERRLREEDQDQLVAAVGPAIEQLLASDGW